jgi:DNA-binding transcriptional ArsR family regulator
MISLRSQISKTLLNYFFINPASRVYVNELSRNLKIDKRNLVRKLKELEKEGILKSESSGNLKLYSVNRNYPLYREYRKILKVTSRVSS